MDARILSRRRRPHACRRFLATIKHQPWGSLLSRALATGASSSSGGCRVRQRRHHCWTSLTDLSASSTYHSSHTPFDVPSLLSIHVCRMLTGACNPMACPIRLTVRVFRHRPGGRHHRLRGCLHHRGSCTARKRARRGADRGTQGHLQRRSRRTGHLHRRPAAGVPPTRYETVPCVCIFVIGVFTATLLARMFAPRGPHSQESNLKTCR